MTNAIEIEITSTRPNVTDIDFEFDGRTVYFAEVRLIAGHYVLGGPDKYIQKALWFGRREDAIAHGAELARDWIEANRAR